MTARLLKTHSSVHKFQALHKQRDQKKVTKYLKSCPKTISREKLKDFDTFTKISLNVGILGKIIVATSLEKLPKV